MTFAPPPETAAWRHLDASTGFEVAYFRPLDGGHRIEGCTTAVEDGRTWIVGYVIDVDAAWITRRAEVTGRSAAGTRHITLEADGAGHWRVDGAPAPLLDGLLDVDLESSAMTNAFPVHRMRLAVGDEADAPAVYVRALDLAVERLDEQHYVRIPDEGPGQRYDYTSVDGFACRLVYDESGIVLDYPGIAVRVR
ncbi:putative glycolipid-binding domain-containing protein [Nonomuraea sp. SYSU D8015]|uniref:putative glycolipid-binding domain-containing protein n=1 Tax=Nonomuraea sp. SYSU D8015 TaxID=2593644 RepID=UPI001660D4FC|nr:putative glycolipid-binding domain-containing protein [Nonomuraea sp. SYSU D8015]